jgi:hypothetical protein
VHMQLHHAKSAIVGGWALGLGAIGLALDVNSLSAWTLFLGVGVLSPLVLLRMWRQPAQSTAESARCDTL